MRPGVEVRPVQPDDVDGVVDLVLEARGESSVAPQVCSPDPVTVRQQIGALTAAPGGTVLVATIEDVVVGLLLGRVVGPNLFTDDTSLVVEVLYVDPRQRRRGVGHALMLGATEVALEAGAEHVYVSPIPGARGMQRFVVQLGFAPAAGHRVTTTTALHRRLTHDVPTVRRSPRTLEDLIARRRQSRQRDTEAPAVVEAARVGGGLARVTASVPEDAPRVSLVGSGAQERRSMSRQVRRAVQSRRELESWTTIS